MGCSVGYDGSEVRKCVNLFQDDAPGKPDVTSRLYVLINKAAGKTPGGGKKTLLETSRLSAFVAQKP
jgi:hypothetical protein